MLRDKKERLRLLNKQTELYYQNCEGCKYISDNNYCRNHCPIGEQMIEIGKALGGEKEPSPRKIEISKEDYLNLRNQGLRNKEIADKLGVSEQLILNRRRDWGISTKRSKPYRVQASEITKKQLKEAEAEGLSNAETAKRYHVSQSKIVRLRKEYGLSRKNTLDRHREEYDRLRSQGVPLKKIAQEMGVSFDSVMRWRKAWGLKGDE